MDVQMVGDFRGEPARVTWHVGPDLSGHVDVDLSEAIGHCVRGSFAFAWGVEDVRLFVASLKRIHTALQGEATLGEYIGFAVLLKMERDGHVLVECTYREGIEEPMVEFAVRGLRSDQSYLPAFWAQLERALP